MPKGNPGPGSYSVTNLHLVQNLNRSKAMEAGFAFPLGPKDAMLAAVNKNLNPGPGTHNIKPDLSCDLKANRTMGLP